MFAGQPYPDRVASYYVTSRKLMAGDKASKGLVKLLDAEVLVHIFFSTNHFAVGAIQAFSEYVRKHRRPCPISTEARQQARGYGFVKAHTDAQISVIDPLIRSLHIPSFALLVSST